MIIYVSAKQTIPLTYFELPSYGIPNLTVITLCVLFIAQDDYDYLVESWQGNILSAEIKVVRFNQISTMSLMPVSFY